MPNSAAWFVESLFNVLVIALVVRTRRPFWRSWPGNTLLVTSLGLMSLAPAIPYLPYASDLVFAPLPASVTLALLAITVAYVGSAEALKRWFYRPAHRQGLRASS